MRRFRIIIGLGAAVFLIGIPVYFAQPLLEPVFVSNIAQSPAHCGNGKLEESELCDDGNYDARDGCTGCIAEQGYSCAGEPSVCPRSRVLRCGNGRIEFPELCDDRNVRGRDGCSKSCALEPGYRCTGNPSRCAVTAVLRQ